MPEALRQSEAIRGNQRQSVELVAISGGGASMPEALACGP